MKPDHIYFCVTKYQLLCMTLHRMRFPEGIAILYIANLTFTNDEIDIVESALTSSGTFEAVKTYDEKDFWTQLARSTVGTAVRNLAGERLSLQHLPEVKQRTLEHFSVNVADVEETNASWYVGADHYSFGMALVLKGTPYTQFEDHSGALSKPHLLLETLVKLNLFQFRAYELMGPQRAASVIAHVVDSLPDPTMERSARPVQELFVLNSLKAMVPEQFAMISEMFGYEPVEFPRTGSEFALLITQPFARWRFLDWARQKELYYTVVDYFAPDAELVIKPHPQDNGTPYGLWFPAASITKASVPMELVLTQVEPSIALTVASTAIFQIPSEKARTISLGQGFEQQYGQIPQLFAISTLFAWLGIKRVVCSSDFPAEALQSFMPDGLVVSENEETTPAVFACKSLPSRHWPATASGIVVSLSPIVFTNSNVTETRLVVLRKPHNSPYTIQTLVYCYSRDPGRFDNMKGKKMERMLPNLREDLTIVFPVDGDPVFLQAQVASLELVIADLTSRLKSLEAASPETSSINRAAAGAGEPLKERI